MQKKTHTW